MMNRVTVKGEEIWRRESTLAVIYNYKENL